MIAHVQPVVDFAENNVLLFTVIRFQNQRTHDRTQRQRHYSRNQYGYSNGNSELTVKLPRNTAEEAHRNKHRTKHQRSGNQRTRQSIHGFLRSFVRWKFLFLHNTLHVFHHDNGIIHYNTDSKNQPQQCQYIQRKAKDQHETERTDQWNRNGNYRDQRSPPALQREINDEHHKNQRLKQGFVYFMNGLGNISRHIEWHLIAQPLREVLADFIHRFLDTFCNFHRVSARKHINAQNGSILAIDPTLRTVWRSFERNPCHVTQTDDRTIRIGTDHNVLKLLYSRKASLCSDRNRYIESLHRLLTKYTCSRLTVLIFQRIL